MLLVLLHTSIFSKKESFGTPKEGFQSSPFVDGLILQRAPEEAPPGNVGILLGVLHGLGRLDGLLLGGGRGFSHLSHGSNGDPPNFTCSAEMNSACAKVLVLRAKTLYGADAPLDGAPNGAQQSGSIWERRGKEVERSFRFQAETEQNGLCPDAGFPRKPLRETWVSYSASCMALAASMAFSWAAGGASS